MFHLNRAITIWRQDLEAQRTLRAADLDELEDHLREEISGLRAAGLSEEEAFQIARMRLGSPHELGGEFAMADPEGRRSFRLRWMVVGALALLAMWLASGMVAGLGTGFVGWAGDRGFPLVGVFNSGFFYVLLRLLALTVGCLLIWRLLVRDSSSRHLSKLNFSRIIGLLLVMMVLVAAARFVPPMVMIHALPHQAFVGVATAGSVLNLILLLILPVVLLLMLWRLVRRA